VLALVDAGEGTHRVDFVDSPLGARSVVHIRPGAVHQWSDVDRIDGTLLLVTPGAAAGDFATTLQELPSRQVTLSAWRLIQTALGHLRAEYRVAVTHSTSSSDTILRHCLAALAVRALTGPTEGHAPQPVTSLFTQYQDAVERNFHRWHNISDYAAELRFSPRTLTRAVMSAAGVSAKQFLDERVALEAKRLLAHSDFTVAQIAHELGFSESSNFSAFFSRFADSPPGRWRERELLHSV